MRSYDEWKAEQRFVEDSLPHVPHSEDKPVGNGINGVSHRVGHGTNKPTFDSTAPSSNSGGMVRKQHDWETFINDKYASAKSEIPEEMPRTSGLGDQGMTSISVSSFPEDPMATQGEELGDSKGQFEHCTWDNYSKWRQGIQEQGVGMQQAAAQQMMGQPQPMPDPRMNPAAAQGQMAPAAADPAAADPAAADPAKPQSALDTLPSGVARVGKYFMKLLKSLSLQKQMQADQAVSTEIAQNLKGGKSAGGRLQRGRRRAASQAQVSAPEAMSKDEKDRPTRPSGWDKDIAAAIPGGNFGPHKKGGPMTMRSMGKQ